MSIHPFVVLTLFARGSYADCSVCCDGYFPSLGASCNKCSENNSLGLALLAVLGVVVFAGFVTFLVYMLSGKELSADRGILARISRIIPLHSLKIVVVVWQILAQVGKPP